jgi:hypothetical protein
MSYRTILDAILFLWTLGSAETVCGGWRRGKADVAEGVDVVYGVVGGSAIGCVGETKEREEAEVS